MIINNNTIQCLPHLILEKAHCINFAHDDTLHFFLLKIKLKITIIFLFILLVFNIQYICVNYRGMCKNIAEDDVKKNPNNKKYKDYNFWIKGRSREPILYYFLFLFRQMRFCWSTGNSLSPRYFLPHFIPFQWFFPVPTLGLPPRWNVSLNLLYSALNVSILIITTMEKN